MLKRPAILCACLLLAALFVFGVVRLFELRFEQGDVYPPYSTLRSDPLGASVFYESLQSLPEANARRFFEASFKDDNGRGRSLFILGTEPLALEMIPRSEFEALQRFVVNGGRMIVAYYPEVSVPREARDSTNRDDRKEVSTNSSPVVKQKKSDPQQDEDDAAAEKRHYADLTEEWGFDVKYKPLAKNDEGGVEFPKARLVAPIGELPSTLTVHTGLCFTNLTNGWKAVYQLDRDTPVVVERKFGGGSVVLVADSYPFSNEALFKEPGAPLLAWLLGSGRDALFDEAHLGIVERPGMATLMRRYQLHGLVLGLILVAGLFVWKNSISLVPRYAETESTGGPVVIGRDSASGFVNLMRRGIAPAEIINVCFAEWSKSNARSLAISPAQRREVEQMIQHQAALAPHLRKPVENYRIISQILRRRK